jgi:hypothetical protein
VKEALQLDKENGNNLLRDAIAAKMSTLTKMCVFDVLKKGKRAPDGYKMIPMRFSFDVRMGTIRRKARLVTGGHTTEPPASDTYSSIALKESVRLSFFSHN